MVGVKGHPSFVTFLVLVVRESFEDGLSRGGIVQSGHHVDLYSRQSEKSKVLLRSIRIVARNDEQAVVSKAIGVPVSGRDRLAVG